MKVGNKIKSNLGRTLRKVREGKQVSICSLSDEFLSKSQISRFERGESEISCSRLINILDKLNLSLDEFLILHEDSYTKSETFTKLIQYLQKEYAAQRTQNISKLLSNTSQYNLGPLEKTMIKSIIHTFDSTVKPTKEELLTLTDYLFKIEHWGYYEIILLGNCARTIEYITFFLLTKEMLRNCIYTSLNKTNKKLVTQLAINCLIISIDKEEFCNCTFLVTEITKLLNNELNYFEQTVFLYANGYFEYKKNLNTGTQKMKQAIQVFELLGEHELKSQYTKHYFKNINLK